MYVVCDGSYCYRIRRFNKNTYERLEPDIAVVGLKKPFDIVVCGNDRQLYVADWDHCVWQVSADDHSFVNWLTIDPEKFDNPTLSLTSRRLLLTSTTADKPNIGQYSTADRRRLRVIRLRRYVEELYHAAETTRDTFVVSHKGTSQDKEQFVVSELFAFCHSCE